MYIIIEDGEEVRRGVLRTYISLGAEKGQPRVLFHQTKTRRRKLAWFDVVVEQERFGVAGCEDSLLCRTAGPTFIRVR